MLANTMMNRHNKPELNSSRKCLVSSEETEDETILSSKFGSIRVLVAFLSLLGTAIMYITRVNLNIAILAMVEPPVIVPTAQLVNNDYQISNSCPNPTIKANINPNITQLTVTPKRTVNDDYFDWTPPEQGVILGSFFYGYLVTQIVGGRLAESYSSPSKLIFMALASSGVINLVTPWLARTTLTGFIASRVVLGAVQGIVYPAFYCLFSRWIPANERSTFIPWLDAGITIGTIITTASSGQIIVVFSKLGGWPIVFYFSGTLALVWSAVWLCLVRSDPEDHPLISERERSMIVNSHQAECSLARVRPNWLRMLTSSAFYSVLVVKITYGVVFDFVTLKMPAFLSDVIHLSVDQTGLAMAFIMTGYMVTLLTGGVLADRLTGRFVWLDRGRARRLFQGVAGTMLACSLLAMSGAGCAWWANVMLLTVSMVGYGFTSGGDIPIVADISGPLSGTVFATMNTLCSVSGVVVPIVVGVVIESAPNSPLLWNELIRACAVLVIGGTVLFLFTSSAKFQSDWIETPDDCCLDDSLSKVAPDLNEPTPAKMRLHSNKDYNTFAVILVK